MKAKAENYLRQAIGSQDACFREGQWECIEGLLRRKRLLVVQRTGWGKSMIYFLATKLLRETGAGPTLLISPLLALMRNQLEAAKRVGIRSATINSTNRDEWEEINCKLLGNEVDILLISPERLANEDFRNEVLTRLVGNVGLFVVDEAHCISDWGHDFRPDYRRIVRVLQAMPANVPVLATTATANNRVVADVQKQLGQNIILQRGSLVRTSLRLQNIVMPSPSARMAWLAQTIPHLPGSGIIYTLTQRDAERVSEWLIANGIIAKPYHADLSNEADGVHVRKSLEKELLDNKVKALVATVALGMGFDKPDLGFVIHFQRPASVVHYYQQVGRAGRAIENAYGVLMYGEEDDQIADYFIRNAFPPQQHVTALLKVLDESENGLSIPDLQRVLNLRKSDIEKTLKFLTVESPAPIVKIKSKWQATAAATSYQINQKLIDEITTIRNSEQKEMRQYMMHKGCLMSFLQRSLDDPQAAECGKCSNCAPACSLDMSYNDELSNKAGIYLKRSYQKIAPRMRWPSKNMFESTAISGTKIPVELQAEEGRTLSLWRDAGWGMLVSHGKYKTNRFSDKLVLACVEMLKAWSPDPVPLWVTAIPSLRNPDLVPNFAKRLADALELPFVAAIEKTKESQQQKDMDNSYYQAKNLDGVFVVNKSCWEAPCLLVDDMVDSRWTFTITAALLRRAGCSAVYPLALALNSPRMD